MDPFTIEAKWAARLGVRMVKEFDRGADTITVSMEREGPVYETIVVESYFLDDSRRTHRIREPRDRARSLMEKRMLNDLLTPHPIPPEDK